jgi:hypothetical protein
MNDAIEIEVLDMMGESVLVAMFQPPDDNGGERTVVIIRTDEEGFDPYLASCSIDEAGDMNARLMVCGDDPDDMFETIEDLYSILPDYLPVSIDRAFNGAWSRHQLH